MRLQPLFPAIAIISGFVLAACASEGAQTVSFTPKYDNIIYEGSETVVSNGQGQTIHVGANGRGAARRGVIAFDVASNVDRGAKVKAVRLVLNISWASDDTPQTVSLYRVTTLWGEGASDAEENEGGGADPTNQDATWIHAAYDNSLWTTPSGDFITEASATAEVGAPGKYTWTSEHMVADVQSWLDNPSTDFGWLIKGNEAEMGTVNRFDSKDNSDQNVLPMLEIEFE